MLFSTLTRKGQVPRHSFHPMRASPGQEKAGLSWRLPQGKISGAYPACHCWGSQVPRTQPALRLLRLPRSQGPGPTDCVLCRLQMQQGRRGCDGGVHHHLKTWAPPVGHLGQGSGALQDTAPNLFPGFPQPPHWPKAQWPKGPLGEGEGPPLTSLSTTGSFRGPPFPGPLTEQGH